MEKLLLTEFEKGYADCKSFELISPHGSAKVYTAMRVTLHPNRVCFFNYDGPFCIDGVKYVIKHAGSEPSLFEIVSRELDKDIDTAYFVKIF